MNPFLLFLIKLLLQIGRKSLATLLEMFGTLEELLSEASFGMFISYCGHNVEGLKSYHEYHTKILRVFTYFCNPYFLYAFNPAIFETDEAVKEFVKSDPFLFALFSHAKQLNVDKLITNDLYEFLNDFLKYPPFNYILTAIILILQNVEIFLQEIAYFFINIYYAVNKNPESFINEVLSKFTLDTLPKILKLPASQLVIRLNPLIHFEFISFIAHVRLNYCYKQIITTMLTPQFPTDFYNKLQARLFFDGKKIAWARPNDEGLATFEIDKSLYDMLQPRLIEIRFLGLRSVRGTRFFRSCELYVHDTRTYIPADDPLFTRHTYLSNGWYEVCFEDMKGQEYPDFDYNDAFFRYKFYGTKMYWEVWNGEHGYTHTYFINGINVAYLPPRSSGTKVKVAEGYLDLNTNEVVITWRA